MSIRSSDCQCGWNNIYTSSPEFLKTATRFNPFLKPVVHCASCAKTSRYPLLFDRFGDAGKLFSSLLEFWDGNIPGLGSFTELLEEDVIIQFGVPPNRIDLINKIDGVGFEEAWKNREIVDLELSGTQIKITYIGLDQLIKNKRAAARPKDQEDLKYLNRAREM